MGREPVGSEARADLLRGSVLLGLVLAAACLIGAVSGAVPVSIGDAVGGDRVSRTILLDIRLPRVILAALVGAVLASAGATFQVLLRNPLADPFVLGVSGGAACGAAVITALGLARIPGVLPGAAFAGAILAALVVLVFGGRGIGRDSLHLLLSGLVLNAFFSAVILLALALSAGGDLTVALRWMMGSFFSAGWNEVVLVGVCFLVAFVVLVRLSSELRMLAYGEEDARSRGIAVERIKRIAFLAASVATGAAVSVSGIIGFVGLLVPHAVRLVWCRDYRVVLPHSALAGAALLVLADAASRSVVAPAELPVGALTALLGVPAFLLLLRRDA